MTARWLGHGGASLSDSESPATVALSESVTRAAGPRRPLRPLPSRDRHGDRITVALTPSLRTVTA
jgi:hypothetical protein